MWTIQHCCFVTENIAVIVFLSPVRPSEHRIKISLLPQLFNPLRIPINIYYSHSSYSYSKHFLSAIFINAKYNVSIQFFYNAIFFNKKMNYIYKYNWVNFH